MFLGNYLKISLIFFFNTLFKLKKKKRCKNKNMKKKEFLFFDIIKLE